MTNKRSPAPDGALRARDIMTSPVVTVSPEDSLEQVAQVILKHRFGGVPVVDQVGKLVGIVTETDFSLHEKGVPFSALRLPSLFGQWCSPGEVERIYAAARTRKVKEIMSQPVTCVAEDTPVGKIAELMLRRHLKRLPVLRDGELVGIVTRHDLLRCLTH